MLFDVSIQSMQTYSSSNLYLNLMTSSASEVAKIPITTRLCFIAVNAVSCIDHQCLSGFVNYTQWSVRHSGVWTGTPGCIFCDQCIKTTWYLQAYECELVLAERRWNSIYSALQTIFSKNLQTTTHIHCVQKKTPTHMFFHISINYLWI